MDVDLTGGVSRFSVLIRDRKPEICGDFVSMNLVLGDDVANVPADIIAKLNTELVKAARAPDIGERMAGDGGEPLGTTPEQFRQHLADEIARWRKVVQVAGIRVE